MHHYEFSVDFAKVLKEKSCFQKKSAICVCKFLILQFLHLCDVLISSIFRASWEDLQQLTKERGRRLRDAEAVHKCFWDLNEALTQAEVNYFTLVFKSTKK